MVQGRYLIVQMIGKGGMGEVYLAVDQRLGSAVALKRTVFTEDETLRAAFEREAKILGRLRHPVLPKVSDHFSENGDQFLVMEHISGDDLSKRLEASGKPFPLSWVMFWADQLLDALTYLHSHEPPIIHRDIKPQNLKLTDDNHIVLLDFGLSKDSQVVASDQPMISASVVGYTPHFASMEQIRGTGTTAKSDIYSFSATFYQLMTNVVPIDALARADAILSGGGDPLIPLNVGNPEVSKEISDVMLKGIEVSQDKRFGTAAEMQKELRRAFKRTQEAMSAKTVAFASPTAPTELVEGDAGAHVTAAPSEMETRIQPTVSETELAETIPNVPPETHAPPRQDDIKTAVFTAEAPVEQPAEAGPATAPEPAVVETAPVVAAPSMSPRPASPPTPMTRAAAASAGAAPRKSKAGLIVGVLIGLLVLAGIAGGGGWYAYTRYYAKAVPIASPTPLAPASPSPEPTIETVADSSLDIDANTAETSEPVPAEPAPGKQPVAGKNPPAKTTQAPPTSKPAPKTKPKDERTVILQ